MLLSIITPVEYQIYYESLRRTNIGYLWNIWMSVNGKREITGMNAISMLIKEAVRKASPVIRGQELDWAPRVEGEGMSAEGHKKQNCNQKVGGCIFKSLCTPQKWTKWKHIKVSLEFFCNLCNHLFYSFETLISNMRCIWLNWKMVINFNIFGDLAIIFPASLKH